MQDTKAVFRGYLDEFDKTPDSLGFIDKWMTPDFKAHFNNQAPMDREGYRQFVAGARVGFSGMIHDIEYVIAEGDLVAGYMTLRMKHTGEYMGVPATGRSLAVKELVVMRIAKGKVAEEWVALDFMSLREQLGG